jgi:hypothetical protein
MENRPVGLQSEYLGTIIFPKKVAPDIYSGLWNIMFSITQLG